MKPKEVKIRKVASPVCAFIYACQQGINEKNEIKARFNKVLHMTIPDALCKKCIPAYLITKH